MEFLKPSNSINTTIQRVKHTKNKDSILISLPDVSGYFRLERYDGLTKVDSIEMPVNETKTLRWHLPPSKFKEDKSYTFKLTELPTPKAVNPPA